MSAEFLLTALVVSVIPGTGVIYTVASSVGGGWSRGMLAAAGCTLGIVPHLLAAMLGLSGLMQAGSLAFEVVRYAGVAFLAFMGIGMILGASSPAAAPEQPAATGSGRAVVGRAVLVSTCSTRS